MNKPLYYCWPSARSASPPIRPQKAVEFREELPKSTVGKFLRRVLVEEERAKAEARPQS